MPFVHESNIIDGALLNKIIDNFNNMGQQVSITDPRKLIPAYVDYIHKEGVSNVVYDGNEVTADVTDGSIISIIFDTDMTNVTINGILLDIGTPAIFLNNTVYDFRYTELGNSFTYIELSENTDSSNTPTTGTGNEIVEDTQKGIIGMLTPVTYNVASLTPIRYVGGVIRFGVIERTTGKEYEFMFDTSSNIMLCLVQPSEVAFTGTIKIDTGLGVLSILGIEALLYVQTTGSTLDLLAPIAESDAVGNELVVTYPQNNTLTNSYYYRPFNEYPHPFASANTNLLTVGDSNYNLELEYKNNERFEVRRKYNALTGAGFIGTEAAIDADFGYIYNATYPTLLAIEEASDMNMYAQSTTDDGYSPTVPDTPLSSYSLVNKNYLELISAPATATNYLGYTTHHLDGDIKYLQDNGMDTKNVSWDGTKFIIDLAPLQNVEFTKWSIDTSTATFKIGSDLWSRDYTYGHQQEVGFSYDIMANPDNNVYALQGVTSSQMKIMPKVEDLNDYRYIYPAIQCAVGYHYPICGYKGIVVWNDRYTLFDNNVMVLREDVAVLYAHVTNSEIGVVITRYNAIILDARQGSVGKVTAIPVNGFDVHYGWADIVGGDLYVTLVYKGGISEIYKYEAGQRIPYQTEVHPGFAYATYLPDGTFVTSSTDNRLLPISRGAVLKPNGDVEILSDAGKVIEGTGYSEGCYIGKGQDHNDGIVGRQLYGFGKKELKNSSGTPIVDDNIDYVIQNNPTMTRLRDDSVSTTNDDYNGAFFDGTVHTRPNLDDIIITGI